MATRSSIREERRKKITERGSDRLALITGQIKSLPSSPISSPMASPNVRGHNKSNTYFSRDRHHEDLHRMLLEQANRLNASNFSSPLGPGAGSEGSRAASASKLLKRESNFDVVRNKAFDIGELVEPTEHENETNAKAVQPPVHKNETYTEARQSPAVHDDTKSESLPAEPKVEKTSNDTESLQKPTKNEQSLFSCTELNSCILASQGTRNFCALVLALLVILSYIDNSLFGINILSSGIVNTFRPLYILLITDVTIVIKLLYLKQQGQSVEAAKEPDISEEDDNGWTQTIQYMERGLVLYQTVRAIFIDFSIYAVIVVCGVSLAQPS